MSVFNGRRLDPAVFQLDSDRLADGWYSDKYFLNIAGLLTELAAEGYTFDGIGPAGLAIDHPAIGDLVVEMQIFTRRTPSSVIVGVDEALAILQAATGYHHGSTFVNTYDALAVEAVEDGVILPYTGDPAQVLPVLRIRGRYRDFAVLETPILGALTEATRVATNVYDVLEAAGGKDILFFPARFAHYKLQALHGYAYSIAVEAYKSHHGKGSSALVSTDEQGAWWGGRGGGTIAHSAIACFLGDAAETMVQFCRVMPPEVQRIALVDFHNDCIGDTLSVMRRLFGLYLAARRVGDDATAERYRLWGVRPDTGAALRDVSIPPLGDRHLDCGVNPRLIHALRTAIDDAWRAWSVPFDYLDEAKAYCRDVKIIATGGFTPERIRNFEQLAVPVDVYGVGSYLLFNSDADGTNNDFTADIVRVQIEEEWIDMAKTGRRPCDNPLLRPV